jgi:type IV secretion system protein VirB10
MFGRNPTPQTDHVTSEMAPRQKSRKRKLADLMLGTVVVLGAGWYLMPRETPPVAPETNLIARNGEIGRDFVPVPPPAQPALPVVVKPPAPPAQTGFTMPGVSLMPRPTVRPPISALQTSGGLRSVQTGPTEPRPSTQPDQGGVESVSLTETSGRDRLDDGLRAGRDGGTVKATMLPDRHLFMTMGTPIPCILEQPINTEVPGPFRCKVKGPVYSTSGAVPLLDDGTWAFGRVSQHLERGMTRAFAVVTRLETPQGCLVKLRASLGDQLGTPGVDGEVDTHFFERFRGVAMIALLDAVGQAAAIAASNAVGAESGISFNQFESGTRDLAKGSYGGDLDIPPTLKTAQARQVLVMAVDDIDMRGCFRLTMAR